MPDDHLPTRPHENSYVLREHRVAAGEYPFHQDPAQGAEKLAACIGFGITCFIDLTTPKDRLRPYETELAARARRVSCEIADLGVPSVAEMVGILDEIDNAVRNHELPYVHCWGGVGRTGTVIGCYLVRKGMTGEAALREVAALFATMSPRKIRHHPGGSPETDEQRQFVLNWKEPVVATPEC